MGLTRLKTASGYSFIQPNVGENVTIKVDSHIDWLTENSLIHVPSGGVYKIISINVFTVILELVKATTEAGEAVNVEVIYPIIEGYYNADSEVKLIKIEASNLVTPDVQGLVNYLNTSAGFQKQKDQQILIEISGVGVFSLVNKRKNTYGLGGILLENEDFVFVLQKLNSSDNSISTANNDITVNTENWQLDTDLDNLTPNIQI